MTPVLLALAQLAAVFPAQLAVPEPPPVVEPAPVAPTKLGEDEDETARRPPVEVPAPTPMLPPLPLPARLPASAGPASHDRVTTSDGREHVGRILRDIEGGLEFENQRGERYPLALTSVVRSQRAQATWAAPAPESGEIDAEAARRALTLAFDVYWLEQERARLTFGEKALALGLGVAAMVLGFAVLDGDVGTVVGVLGAIGAGGGGVALGVTALRSLSLGRRAREGREALAAMGAAPVVTAREVHLPALAISF